MTEYFLYIAIAVLLIALGVAIKLMFVLYKKMHLIADQTDILLQELDSFLDHLNKMNSSDLFFGEPLIVSLVNHSKYLTNTIETFLGLFSFMRVEEPKTLDKNKTPEIEPREEE